jgi:hypothetical protein
VETKVLPSKTRSAFVSGQQSMSKSSLLIILFSFYAKDKKLVDKE